MAALYGWLERVRMVGGVSVLIEGGGPVGGRCLGRGSWSENSPPENNIEINGKKLVQSKASFVVLSRPGLGLRWIFGLAVVSEGRCAWLK